MNEHSQKVYNVMLYLGYPESFALLIARHPSPSPLRCPEDRILIG